MYGYMLPAGPPWPPGVGDPGLACVAWTIDYVSRGCRVAVSQVSRGQYKIL
jgi:hypothetical protein